MQLTYGNGTIMPETAKYLSQCSLFEKAKEIELTCGNDSFNKEETERERESVHIGYRITNQHKMDTERSNYILLPETNHPGTKRSLSFPPRTKWNAAFIHRDPLPPTEKRNARNSKWFSL
ncbi:hypothetical protein CDAR_375041 [Caerostris darwini]|uniref:Uncharacterized protein n=1 Tax=Caerostris darwini TaxID=1538125 RepID=A0AAV4RK31_9ARAC|nr:hypothetical protein CDAR_375041 [Caerostris darwini]